jgi:peptide/nickel transport system ATP-binding protein
MSASEATGATPAPLLEVRGLRTWMQAPGGTVRAVDGASLAIRRGETLALLGESGSGKSVTAASILRLLPGNARVVEGEVRLEGQDLLALSEREMRTVRGLRIGMVFQEPMLSLDPVMRVGEQVDELLRRRHPEPPARRRERAIELLRAVGLTEPWQRIDDYPFQLSGGMRQRAMLAIALAGEPDLLIADEPTTALDVTTQAQVLDLLAATVQARGMGLLLITHDLGVVARWAQRVAVMYAGQVVETAPVVPFLEGPRHPYARRLMEAIPGPGARHRPLAVIPGSVPVFTADPPGCRFASRCSEVQAVCQARVPEVVAVGPAHEVRCLRFAQASGFVDESGEGEVAGGSGAWPRSSAGSGVEAPASRVGVGSTVGEAAPALRPEGLLEVRGLEVRFPVRGGLLRRVQGWVRAVDGVDLSIARGRTLALVGESGCGKTTVGKALLRLVEASAGEVRFDGTDLRGLRRAELRPLRARVQIVFQDPYGSLDPRLRVEQTLDEGMCSLRPQWDAAERSSRIDRLLEEVGLPIDARRRYPHQFSGGQRQRVAIARALSVEPELLVCDEPTSALDVSVQAQVLNLLRELQARRGLACLFITHNLAVVETMADEVAVMYLGRIVERGPVDRVLAAPAHPYTRALLAAVPRLDRDRARPAADGAVVDVERPSNRVERIGCDYRARCPLASAPCASQVPAPVEIAPGHCASCHALTPGTN